MAIKDEAAFAELRPYLKMTVAPNGVTIGDLNFVVAQTQWSTALQAITVANTVPADVNLDLFQSAQGDVGQGFSTALTRGQTSWLDSQGRLPANQVFIATSCGFQFFVREATTDPGDPASTTQAILEHNIPSEDALYTIGRNLSWDATIGDGITRNYGNLLWFGGYGANYGVTAPANDPEFTVGAIAGDSASRGRHLRIPLVFPPNINVRIKVRGGNSFAVPNTASAQDTLPVGSKLAIRQFLHGYLCTMPV